MRWTTVARVSCSCAAAARTACITSRNVKASELTMGTVSCAKRSTVVVLHDTQYPSNIHASASYPECTPPDSGPAIRRSGLAARHRLGRVPPPLTAALHAGMGRYGHPWEGVSELLICYPVWASERNRTTRVMVSHNDYTSAALPVLPRDRYRPPWHDT